VVVNAGSAGLFWFDKKCAGDPSIPGPDCITFLSTACAVCGDHRLKHLSVPAELRQWRVPEATLCATAVAGGWVGGSWAMQRFRHKTAKKSFKDVSSCSVARYCGS